MTGQEHSRNVLEHSKDALEHTSDGSDAFPDAYSSIGTNIDGTSREAHAGSRPHLTESQRSRWAPSNSPNPTETELLPFHQTGLRVLTSETALCIVQGDPFRY